MIPNKSNFKFQELTPITGVKPYVIRFWETEFHEIAPVISECGQKLYSRSDVEVIFKIKKLLFEDKLTIPEAKNRIGDNEIFVPKIENPMIHAAGQIDIRSLILSALETIKEVKSKRNW